MTRQQRQIAFSHVEDPALRATLIEHLPTWPRLAGLAQATMRAFADDATNPLIASVELSRRAVAANAVASLLPLASNQGCSAAFRVALFHACREFWTGPCLVWYDAYTGLASLISEQVSRLRRNGSGYPSGLTEETWHDILDDIAKACDIVVADDFDRSATEQEKVDRGFALLGKWFLHLWD